MPTRSRRRRRRILLAALLPAVLVVVVATVVLVRTQHLVASCSAGTGSSRYVLSPEQAVNASTVAVVAERLGLPHHAVTVALVAALQESKLRNVDYGDRDSIGIFQQRPSQGWGTAKQVSDPAYASAAFLRRLAQVPHWETLPVEDAAQAVQRSADGSAYADWEPQARVLARALTGEVPAAFTCHFRVKRDAVDAAGLRAALAKETGSGTLSGPNRPVRGWSLASWLVAHAQQYGIDEVTYAGHRWTSGRGEWSGSGGSGGQVQAGFADGTRV